MTDSVGVFFQSDLSQAALDAFDFPSWAFVQYFGANTLAHVGIGAIAASVCVAAFYGSTRGHLIRGSVGLVLLAAVVMKDFSQDFLAGARELLVFLDIFWDAASYFAGWWLIETNGRIVAQRTRKAMRFLQENIGLYGVGR
jgi:hypothetical protein